MVKNKRNDDTGRILILDVTIDDTYYILINVYNAININTERKLKPWIISIRPGQIAGDRGHPRGEKFSLWFLSSYYTICLELGW